MKINDTDIRTFGARQARVTIGHHDWKRSSDWLPGAVLPVSGISSIAAKDLKVILNLKGTGRESLIAQRSDLLALLKDPVELALDGFSHFFHATLKSHKETEISKFRWHQLELDFEGYEYGASVTVQTTNASSAALTVTNPGNLVSPCCVEITPRAGAQSIVLTGLCRDSFTGADLPVTISDIVIGKVIRIDALSGLITEAGALKDMDIWALPSMKPGTNIVSCNNGSMTIKVTTTPLYE